MPTGHQHEGKIMTDGAIVAAVGIEAVAEVQHHAPCVPECATCHPPTDESKVE